MGLLFEKYGYGMSANSCALSLFHGGCSMIHMSYLYAPLHKGKISPVLN
jgi:hypothetical protein